MRAEYLEYGPVVKTAHVGQRISIKGATPVTLLRSAFTKGGFVVKAKCVSTAGTDTTGDGDYLVEVVGGEYNGHFDSKKPKEEQMGHVDARHTQELNQLVREGYTFRNITRKKLQALAQSIRNRGYSTRQTMIGPDLYNLTVGAQKWPNKIKAAANGTGTTHGVSFTATKTASTVKTTATTPGKGIALTMLLEFPPEIAEQIVAQAVEKLTTELKENVREAMGTAITQALGATFGVK